MTVLFNRLLLTSTLAMLLAAIGCGGHAAAPVTPTPIPVGAPLYKRLGGYDAIAAVTDDFVGRLVADSAIKPFFDGIPDSVMRRIRQHVVDQLCEVTGGPCFYLGKTMKETHTPFEITNDIWDRTVRHLQDTLRRFAVPSREQNELVALVASLKADIVK
jgi:hemoglobin